MGVKESVFTKRPGCMLRHVNMSLTLENLQRYVGGYLEILPLGVFCDQDVILICNEEGKLRHLEPNFVLTSMGSFLPVEDVIVGDVVFAASRGEEIVGLEGDIVELREWLMDQGVVFYE